MVSRRAILASLVAAAVVTAVIAVEGYISVYLNGPRQLSEGALSQTLMYAFLIGWPIACVVALIASGFGLPFLRTRVRSPAVVVVCSASILGAIVLPAAWAILWSTSNGLLGLSAFGAIAGVAGGVSFWLLIRPEMA